MDYKNDILKLNAKEQLIKDNINPYTAQLRTLKRKQIINEVIIYTIIIVVYISSLITIL